MQMQNLNKSNINKNTSEFFLTPLLQTDAHKKWCERRDLTESQTTTKVHYQ